MTTTVGRYIGQSVKRREDPRLLTGHGRYVDDDQKPGTLHATFVRSNVARGRITKLDVTEALQVPGVEAIYTGDDLNPTIVQYWASMMGPRIEMGGESVYPPVSVLAPGDVRYVGDPIAIVIATSRYIAEDAADLVDVEIDPLPPVLGLRAPITNTELVHPETESNVSQTMPMPEIPEIEALFANAPHVIARKFGGARATNVPMEPRGLTVQYDRYRGEMFIRAATQSVHEIKSFAGRLTGLARVAHPGGRRGRRRWLRPEDDGDARGGGHHRRRVQVRHRPHQVDRGSAREPDGLEPGPFRGGRPHVRDRRRRPHPRRRR